MYKQKNKQKGITLISLVVTIIVLIILAGVSISMLVGDNGIITQAQNAKRETEEAQAREKLDLALIELQTEKYMNSNYNAEQFVTDYLTNKGMVVQEDIVIVDGYQFVIDRENLTITQSLGKGTESQTIEIALNSNLASDYTKATLSIEIQGSDNISKIQINGTEVNVPEKADNKYTVTQEVTTNGNYSVYVLDDNEEYKIGQVQVTGISEDMQISTKEELASFRDRVNNGATYEGRTITLKSDIDLQGNVDNQWIPIGRDDSIVFKGTFDGDNHVIRNIYIDTIDTFQGLFGSVQDATIKNITVTGSIVNAGDWVGGIASSLLGNTRITNCHNEINIQDLDSYYIGGVVGVINTQSVVEKCSNKGNVRSTGKTKGDETFIGGISGACHGHIESCYNAGNIYGYRLAGGITGGLVQGEIRNCYNIGSIEVETRTAGGISGYIHYYSQATVGYTRIINTYSTGIVNGPMYIGASIGEIANKEIPVEASNNYALNQNSVPAIGGGVTNTNVKAELKTSEELKQLIGTLGEAFQADAKNINDGYPILSWQ